MGWDGISEVKDQPSEMVWRGLFGLSTALSGVSAWAGCLRSATPKSSHAEHPERAFGVLLACGFRTEGSSDSRRLVSAPPILSFSDVSLTTHAQGKTKPRGGMCTCVSGAG